MHYSNPFLEQNGHISPIKPFPCLNNRICTAKAFLPDFSVFIWFLRNGTGFSNHQSAFYLPEPEF